MPDDTFPDAEQRFRDAYALPDPTPELVNLIKAHPTFRAMVDLLVYYTFVVEENPSRANILALALLAVRDSLEAPVAGGLDLPEVFTRKLADLHRRGFDLDNPYNDTDGFTPTNTYLLTSLQSGLSIKYNLTSSLIQYENIVRGLGAPDNSSDSEVLVVGACIQLLTSGSEMFPATEPDPEAASEVVTKLQVQKSRGTVKDANALELLELALSHAETGFKGENDIDNVWEILFPSQT